MLSHFDTGLTLGTKAKLEVLLDLGFINRSLNHVIAT